jgi:hypothetical protein
MHYILLGTEVVEEPDYVAWRRWMWPDDSGDDAHRRVARTQITDAIEVSTLFLGLDMRVKSPVPILFESCVRGGPLDDTTQRYATYHEAEQGHEALVACVRAALTGTE